MPDVTGQPCRSTGASLTTSSGTLACSTVPPHGAGAVEKVWSTSVPSGGVPSSRK